eukprot:3824014-Amphidinium_carterae.1
MLQRQRQKGQSVVEFCWNPQFSGRVVVLPSSETVALKLDMRLLAKTLRQIARAVFHVDEPCVLGSMGEGCKWSDS